MTDHPIIAECRNLLRSYGERAGTFASKAIEDQAAMCKEYAEKEIANRHRPPSPVARKGLGEHCAKLEVMLHPK